MYMGKISAVHLKLYKSIKLYLVFVICFTGFLTHGILPDSILSVVLVPNIIDKADIRQPV